MDSAFHVLGGVLAVVQPWAEHVSRMSCVISSLTWSWNADRSVILDSLVVGELHSNTCRCLLGLKRR